MKQKCIFLLLLLFCSAKLFAKSEDLNYKIKAEALAKVSSFVNLIPQGRENEYGFSTRTEFSSIKVEEPYQAYYVSKEANELALVPTNWQVPLSVNGKYVALLTVELRSGKPEVVDFGGSVLAKKIQEFEVLHPNNIKQRVFIRNTILVHDYITTNVDELCIIKENGFTKRMLNAGSALVLYQINEGQPLAVSITAFYEETMTCIHDPF